jgi:hypothetical protein
MKRIIATMSAVLCLAGAANAGDARSHGVSGRNMSSKSQVLLFGVDSDFSLPISSNYSDFNGLGLGALLTAEYPMIEQLSLTARAGFSFHLNKSPPGAPTVDSHVHNIPVLLGAKYYLMETDRQGLFAAAEMGMFALLQGQSSGAASASQTDVKFGVGAGVGYGYKEWNFRVNIHTHDVGNLGDAVMVSGNIGYQFGGI